MDGLQVRWGRLRCLYAVMNGRVTFTHDVISIFEKYFAGRGDQELRIRMRSS